MNDSTRQPPPAQLARASQAPASTRPSQVIRLEKVSKVFAVEDVETHALSEVDLTMPQSKPAWKP